MRSEVVLCPYLGVGCWMSGIVTALTLAVSVSSTAIAQDEVPIPVALQTDSIFRQPPVSAWGAFVRSLVLPGWGQAELGYTGRGAAYFFVEAFSIVMIGRTQQRLNHAERTLPPDDPLIEQRKQQREDWIALAIFTAFFSAADGWVSVQLWGFDEVTGSGPDDVAFNIGWRIPFGP